MLCPVHHHHHHLGYPAREHQGRGEPPGKMPAAAVVAAAPISHMGGVVGVAGTGQILRAGVVPRANVGVFNEDAQGRAGGSALKDAGDDLGLVGLLPGGGQGAFSRSPAGTPSSTTPMAGPWDSPKMEYLMMVTPFLPFFFEKKKGHEKRNFKLGVNSG